MATKDTTNKFNLLTLIPIIVCVISLTFNAFSIFGNYKTDDMLKSQDLQDKKIEQITSVVQTIQSRLSSVDTKFEYITKQLDKIDTYFQGRK